MAWRAGLIRVVGGMGLLIGVAVVIGCGDDAGGNAEADLAQRIEQARKEGAREARQGDRLKGLQKRVRRLERDGSPGSKVVVEESTDSGGEIATGVIRAFHTPNVSCEIRNDGAVCSVISIGITFAMEGSEAAYIEDGGRVSSGAGAPASWDSTVSAGSITCRIPAESEPRGVTCMNNATGHGFEASRVPERQRAY